MGRGAFEALRGSRLGEFEDWKGASEVVRGAQDDVAVRRGVPRVPQKGACILKSGGGLRVKQGRGAILFMFLKDRVDSSWRRKSEAEDGGLSS